MKNIAALVLCVMATVTTVSPATSSPATSPSSATSSVGTPERRLSWGEKLFASAEEKLADKLARATKAEDEATAAEELVPVGDTKSQAAKKAKALREKATKAQAEAAKAQEKGVSPGLLARFKGKDAPLSPARSVSLSAPTPTSPQKLAGDVTFPTSKPASKKEELVRDAGVVSDEESAHESGSEGGESENDSLSDIIDDTAKSPAMKPLPMDDLISDKVDGHPAFTPSASVTKDESEVECAEAVEDASDKTISELVKTGDSVVVTDTVDDSVVLDKIAPTIATDSAVVNNEASRSTTDPVVIDAPKAEANPLIAAVPAPAPVVVDSLKPTQPAPSPASATVVSLPQPPVSVLTNGGAVEEVVKQLPDLTEDEAAVLHTVLLRAAGIVLMTPAIVYVLYRLVHGLHKTNGLVDGAVRSSNVTDERPLSKRRIKDIVAALSLVTGAALVVAGS